MSTSGPGVECTLYHAGHRVHWIQVTGASLPRDPRGGRIVSIAGGIITVDINGEARCYRNHATRQLRAMVKELGTEVVVDAPRALLKVPVPDEGALKCFSIVAVGKPWHRCRFDQLTQFDPEALAKRSITHGGFSVPGQLLLEHLGGHAPSRPLELAPIAYLSNSTNSVKLVDLQARVFDHLGVYAN